MSKSLAHNRKLDNTNHLWNIALDNYELDGQNEGQESLVGDDSDNGNLGAALM